MKKAVWMILLLATALLLGGCGSQQVEAPELLTPVGAKMDTAVATVGDLEEIAVYAGAVAPRYYSLYFTHDAVIGPVPVIGGQQVRTGDVVIAMDLSSVNGKLAALDAETEALRREAERLAELKEIDLELYDLYLQKAADEDERYALETEKQLYQLEYDNGEATRADRLTAIAEEKAALEKQLEGTTLNAPGNGRVVALNCHAGQAVGAYDTVCVVTDDDDLTVQSDFVSASVLSQAVELYAMIGGERYPLTAEAVDEAEYARTVLKGGKYLSVFTVEDPSKLALGQSAAVCAVTMRVENVLKVPVNAVFEDSGETCVYLVENGSRVRHSVTTGASSDSEIEITEGLTEGDVVYVGE